MLESPQSMYIWLVYCDSSWYMYYSSRMTILLFLRIIYLEAKEKTRRKEKNIKDIFMEIQNIKD